MIYVSREDSPNVSIPLNMIHQAWREHGQERGGKVYPTTARLAKVFLPAITRLRKRGDSIYREQELAHVELILKRLISVSQVTKQQVDAKSRSTIRTDIRKVAKLVLANPPRTPRELDDERVKVIFDRINMKEMINGFEKLTEAMKKMGG